MGIDGDNMELMNALADDVGEEDEKEMDKYDGNDAKEINVKQDDNILSNNVRK